MTVVLGWFKKFLVGILLIHISVCEPSLSSFEGRFMSITFDHILAWTRVLLTKGNDRLSFNQNHILWNPKMFGTVHNIYIRVICLDFQALNLQTLLDIRWSFDVKINVIYMIIDDMWSSNMITWNYSFGPVFLFFRLSKVLEQVSVLVYGHWSCYDSVRSLSGPMRQSE